MRERVSKMYGFFSICVFLLLIWRTIILISTNEPRIYSVKFDDDYRFIPKQFIENSLMIWAKPDLNFLRNNIWEMEPYVKNFKLENNSLIISLRKPFLILRGCKSFFLISNDGVFLEKLKDEDLLRIDLPVITINSNDNCPSFSEGCIKDHKIVEFLGKLSNISQENFRLISEIDFTGMKVFLRKGIVIKVNKWSNFIENSGIIDDVLKYLDKGTVVQLLSNGRLLILPEER